MFSQSKAITNNTPSNAGAFIKVDHVGGLPINHKTSATTAADVASNDTITRRVDYCRTPSSSSIISKPTLIHHQLSNKRQLLPATREEEPLKLGPNTSSLIDDDDDLVDYFAPTTKRTKKCVDTNTDSRSSSSSSSNPLRWEVQEHQVPTLPAFNYPLLEQSSVLVPKALSVSTLASRIVSILEARSISVTSYEESNYARVDCLTQAKVEFRIQMYRPGSSRDEEYQHQHGIIVEVQRLRGFDLSYIQDVYSILDAAAKEEGAQTGLNAPRRVSDTVF